jgi:hypothetical protein
MITTLTEEEMFWREHRATQLNANDKTSFDQYAHARQIVTEPRQKCPGHASEQIEHDVILDCEHSEVGEALPWERARHAVHAAWAKLSHDVGPRDVSRGIRSGF